MRPLHTTTLKFEGPGNDARGRGIGYSPGTPYAILSHRWMSWSDDEVLYEDIKSGNSSGKPGFAKVQGATAKARSEGFDWIWIDTCCIDKRNSAELAKSINSMYQWYRAAARCYVYLFDVGPGAKYRSLHESEWFERGWTLQELLAPVNVEFFDYKWTSLGTKRKLAAAISSRTGIDIRVLEGGDIQNYSVAQKMSWAANRKTTLPEDIAYCLVGIFDVTLIFIYGEGDRAFLRLQEEIISRDDDHSIFAWSIESHHVGKLSGLLAPSPSCFRDCSMTVASPPYAGHKPYSITNRGLSIHLEVTAWNTDTYLAFLDCRTGIRKNGRQSTDFRVALFLRRLRQDNQYARIDPHRNGGIYLAGVKEKVYWDCVKQKHDHPRPLNTLPLFICKSNNEASRAVMSL